MRRRRRSGYARLDDKDENAVPKAGQNYRVSILRGHGRVWSTGPSAAGTGRLESRRGRRSTRSVLERQRIESVDSRGSGPAGLPDADLRLARCAGRNTQWGHGRVPVS